jgi:hypothetical protein
MVYPSQPRHAGKYSLPLPIVTMHEGLLPAVDFPHDPNPVIPAPNVVSPRYLDNAFEVAPVPRLRGRRSTVQRITGHYSSVCLA